MTETAPLSLDRISLEQALKDVEVANGRVMDLTKRLVIMNKELAQHRKAASSSYVADLEAELTRLRSELALSRLSQAQQSQA
jgi:hypothetical protein